MGLYLGQDIPFHGLFIGYSGGKYKTASWN